MFTCMMKKAVQIGSLVPLFFCKAKLPVLENKDTLNVCSVCQKTQQCLSFPHIYQMMCVCTCIIRRASEAHDGPSPASQPH
mmetsp:Transcript_35439/g.57419  ORF Transcript_35439/g.57419 Transcript_35439/m.57419 type:complete len:81 (-) Transcript_35439:110-352(-)